MKINRATEANAAQLVELSKTLGYKVEIEGVSLRLKDILSRSDHVFFVAMDGDRVVGFIHGYIWLMVEVPAAVEFGGLAVAEDYQNKGVGKRLIQAIEVWAREKKISWLVLSSNIIREDAHGFYEHMGYKKYKQSYWFEKRLNIGDVA